MSGIDINCLAEKNAMQNVSVATHHQLLLNVSIHCTQNPFSQNLLLCKKIVAMQNCWMKLISVSIYI